MLSKRDNISPEIKIDQRIYKTTHHKTSVCRRPGVTRIFNPKYDVLCVSPGECSIFSGSTTTRALGRSKFPLASWRCPGNEPLDWGGPHKFKQSPMNHGWVATTALLSRHDDLFRKKPVKKCMLIHNVT